MQRKIHNRLCCLFGSSYAIAGHFFRHRSFGLVNTVLYFNSCNIRVFVQIKINIKRITTIVRTGRTHIKHILYAINLLLDGLRNSLFNCLGVSANISSRHCNLRFGNIWILSYRQIKPGKGSQQGDKNCQHYCKDRTVNKKTCH
ncbi:hypothetical protein SDC9_112165 [bioreactor metagenome]|uniref:Uncharacterized protein n=1 Tax=bioreactor metagenome TaxID=1076179 RepID=A0A645BII5_9ZZZZ